jgi:hypothetical protein
MAHYAFLDENNIVTEVITGVDEHIIQTNLDGSQVGGSSEAWETWYGNFRGQVCKRTSYNGNYRKNYAVTGFTYDEERDAFISPKPFSKWVLDEDTCQWKAPIPYPKYGTYYVWNENKGEWEELVIEEGIIE